MKPDGPVAYIMAPTYNIAAMWWKRQGFPTRHSFQYILDSVKKIRTMSFDIPLIVLVGDKQGSFSYKPQQIEAYEEARKLSHRIRLLHKTMESPLYASDVFY